MAWTELYVRDDAAGGGNGTTNANSGGTGALTWAEMLAYGGSTAITGKRFNVRSGTYARTTSTDTFTVTAGAATAVAPCAIRGFNATAGDLEANGRTNGSGPLVTTNFPSLTYTTGKLTLPANCIMEHMMWSSAASDDAVLCGTSCVVRRCKGSNTNGATGSNSASAIALGSAYSVAIDCDFTGNGEGTAAYVVQCDRGTVIACRVTGLTTGTRGIILKTFAHAIDCQLFDCSKGIVVGGAEQWNIVGCSFRGCVEESVYNSGGQYQGLLVNCAAWGAAGSSKWYGSNASVRPYFQANNAIGNMGAADANEGDYVASGAGVGEVALSADPFTSSTDLRLNSTAGGGAACKGVGLLPYMDIGAVQVQASSASVKLHPGMSGVSIA